jgi:hypothetical protein
MCRAAVRADNDAMGQTWNRRIANPDARAAASAMREEWRAEQEQASLEAVEDWRHQRTLRDVAIEIAHRGDPIVALLSNVRFHGDIEAIGDDVLSLRTVRGRVDVHLHPAVPLVLQVGERVKDGGQRESLGDGDFRGALLARERFGEVTIGCLLFDEPIDGKLLVGADHVTVTARGGAESFLPLWSVMYVMPRRD